MLKKAIYFFLILSASCLSAGYTDGVEQMLTAMEKKWLKKETLNTSDEKDSKEQIIEIAYGPADKGTDVDNWDWALLVHVSVAPKVERMSAKQLYTSTVKAIFPADKKQPKVIQSDEKSIFASWFLHNNYSWVRFIDTDKASIMLNYTVKGKKPVAETSKILEPLMQKITFND